MRTNGQMKQRPWHWKAESHLWEKNGVGGKFKDPGGGNMLILRWKKKSNPSVGKELNLLNSSFSSSHCISLLKPTIATKTKHSILL